MQARVADSGNPVPAVWAGKQTERFRLEVHVLAIAILCNQSGRIAQIRELQLTLQPPMPPRGIHYVVRSPLCGVCAYTQHSPVGVQQQADALRLEHLDACGVGSFEQLLVEQFARDLKA
jgi:hypothetical protein